MNRKIRQILFVIYIIVIVIIGIFTHDITVVLPAAWFMGTMGAIFWGSIEAIGIIGRGLTNQIITNTGHYSIRHDDITHIPWTIQPASKTDNKQKTKKENENNSKTIMLTYALTGGIHLNKFYTTNGRKEDPVFIFPTDTGEQLENNYKCNSFTFPFDLDELPPGIRFTLKKQFPNRVTEKTSIFFGLQEEYDPEDEKTDKNPHDVIAFLSKQISVRDEYIKELHTLIGKDKGIREKNVVLGEKLKKVEEE